MIRSLKKNHGYKKILKILSTHRITLIYDTINSTDSLAGSGHRGSTRDTSAACISTPIGVSSGLLQGATSAHRDSASLLPCPRLQMVLPRLRLPPLTGHHLGPRTTNLFFFSQGRQGRDEIILYRLEE